MTALARTVTILVKKGYLIMDINPCVGSTYADLFMVSESENGTAIAVVIDVRDNLEDASKAFSERAKVAKRLALVKATEMKYPRYRADKFILYKNGCADHIKGVESDTNDNAVDHTTQVIV